MRVNVRVRVRVTVRVRVRVRVSVSSLNGSVQLYVHKFNSVYCLLEGR